MPTTLENLKEAFAGESQANRKYLAWAAKADKEGFAQIAKLFRATADAETVHSTYHLKNMGGIGTTLENLREAIAGETFEAETMYPPMLEQAEKEGHKAKTGFKFAVEAEKVHADLFKQALAALEAGADLEGMDVYLCPVCGHLEFGQAPDKCPICNVPASKYVKIN
ncbi:rubrerythrin family protein [Myxococcota bacterium]|nr:rubrerythrin family protein [Myxococcota bacterium]